jgi:alpha-ribazole phosphatase
MDIYLTRHSVVYNPNKLCYGQSEIPLEENFTADFDWIKDHLNLTGDTIFYSSPFRRCTKLANYLSDDDYKTDNRITELNFGDWEMKPWNEIPEKELNPWMEDFVNHRMKNGENFNDLYDRSVQFYKEITNSKASNVVILTHAGVIRSIASYVLDFPLEKAFNLQIDYSSISKLEYDAKNQLSKVVFMNLHKEAINAVKIIEEE